MQVMEDRQPAVSCTSCSRSWNSASMAEGLRLLGNCPRCGGALSFRDESAPASAPETTSTAAAEQSAVAPHLVLGIPRRDF
jgi:hypothetical protein